MHYLITVVDSDSVWNIYLPFNVDFITLTVTSHCTTEVSWRVGFCMCVCESLTLIYIYALMCKRYRSAASNGELGLKEELGAMLQTIVLYSKFCGTCLELPQVMFV